MPGTSWRNVAGYVTFDAPKCQGTLSRTLTYLLDYIHYNPVKHGYVSNPADYQWSSFKAHQAKGRYPTGWAKTQMPGAIKSLDFE